jgi:hypothetical protein
MYKKCYSWSSDTHVFYLIGEPLLIVEYLDLLSPNLVLLLIHSHSNLSGHSWAVLDQDDSQNFGTYSTFHPRSPGSGCVLVS